MKNISLIFLLVSFFCFANGQDSDSTLIKLNSQLAKKNEKIENLIKKVEVVERKNETAFNRMKNFVKSIMKKNQSAKNVDRSNSGNRDGIKTDEQSEPITEIDLPDGIDSIKGGFLYRLFNKNNYIYKKYKILNNEKIYLD